MSKVLGLRSSFPTKLDATINKIVLPLTESPDSMERLDVKPKLQKGDTLPSVKLKFSDGKTGFLNEYANKPLLVIFVRGSWCSYSRLHLADVMSNKDKFESAGVKLLAITGYKDQEWWCSHGIDIPMCVDSEGDVFKEFGVQIVSWIESFQWITPTNTCPVFQAPSYILIVAVRFSQYINLSIGLVSYCIVNRSQNFNAQVVNIDIHHYWFSRTNQTAVRKCNGINTSLIIRITHR